MAAGAQTLGEGSGVDGDRAAGLAHPVSGTGLQSGVAEVARQALQRRRRLCRGLLPDHLPANGDALAGSEGELATGTDRLTVAALDAHVGFLLDGGKRLEVAEVCAGIGGDDDARC